MQPVQHRFRFAAALKIAAAILLTLLAGVGCEADDAAPNLVFLIVDDLGWADVGYHGGEVRTPTIDALANDGVRLERFYAHPVCSPTRGALMTGRSPLTTGVVMPFEPWYEKGMPIDEKFMPAYLREAGYETFAVGKWHLGPNHVDHHPMTRGFDHFYGHLGGFMNFYTHTLWRRVDWQRNGQTIIEEGYSTHLIADEAIRVMQDRDKNKPMFLYVTFNAPHTPLQAPEAAVAEYAQIEDKNRRIYAAMVSEADVAIGRILDALSAEGLNDNTLVVFMSDNGGAPQLMADNGPLRGGKGSTWEGGIRVPAVMRWPGTLEAGSVYDRVMSVDDLLPTTAAALGLSPDWKNPLDGSNEWLAVAQGRAPNERARILTNHSPNGFNYAIVEDDWKLVHTFDREKRGFGTHLFRISEDPNEEIDVAAEHPEVVERLAMQFKPTPRENIVGIDDPPVPTMEGLGGPSSLAPDFRPIEGEPYAETARRD